MSSPSKASHCQHDPDVLRDLAYDSARSSMEMGSEGLGSEMKGVEDSAAPDPIHGLGAGHLGSEQLCSDCRFEVLRVSRILRVLFELKPVSAPFDLNGRVVAAAQAGHRQDRAVQAVQFLTRVSVPQELELRLRADQAIGDLDPGLSSERASDSVWAPGTAPSSGMVPGESQHLSNSDEIGASEDAAFSAPPELDERVALELSRRLGHSDTSQDNTSRSNRRGFASSDLSRSRSLAFGALVGAAALLLLVQLRLQGTEEDTGAGTEPQLAGVEARPQAPRLEDEDLDQMAAELGLTFRVRRLNSAKDLDPLARDLFDHLRGPRVARADSPDETSASDSAGDQKSDPNGDSKEKGF